MAVMDHIEIEVYHFSDPTTKKDTLPNRQSPAFLNELGEVGGGSITISVSDPKIVKDPTLIASRNVIKQRVGGLVTGAFLVDSKKSVTISDGEKAKEAYEIAGPGLKNWFDDAEVRPYGGLRSTSLDERSFSFASEQGEWYIAADWVAPYVIGPILLAPWEGRPDKWPEGAPLAKWIWGEAYTGSAPIGSCFFRYEFTSTETKNYAVYAAGDDTYSIHVDGQRLMTSDPRYSANAEAAKVEFSLPAGDHVLAIEGRNVSGKAGIVASMFTVVGDAETLVTYTGGTGWLANAYPEVTPGWSAGEILLTLLAEAESRGVLFPTYLTPTFTTTHDSYGDPWGEPLPWSFGVGESMLSVVKKLEELVCDIWIDPDTYELNMVAERGVDRTVFGYDVDEVTVISTPVIFEKGKNLRQASTESRGKIKNSLSIKTDSGWLEQAEVEVVSAGIYGVLEGTLNTGASPAVSKVLATVVFRHRATEEEGASYDVFPTDKIPSKDFHEGDWVLAPDEKDLLVPRRVMSISTNEGESGIPLYTLEFDTIFRENDDRLNTIISKLGGGGVGGSFSNAGGGDSSGPIVVSPPPPSSTNTPQKIPKAPTNVSVTSIGYWSPDGVTPFAEATVTWDPVTENTDGTATVPAFYRVWGHLSSATDDAYMMYAIVTGNEAIIRPFQPSTDWTFKVEAMHDANRISAFSPEVGHEMVGPEEPLIAPAKPTLSSSRGVLTVNWSGLLNDNQSPPPSFRYVYAKVSLFEADSYVQMGPVLFRGGGDMAITGLEVGQLYDVELYAVDGVGIESPASEKASHIVVGITGPDIEANSVTTNELAAGAVRTNNLHSEVGAQLNLESNTSVQIVVGEQLGSLQDDINSTSGNLAEMQTYYKFSTDGAEISKPGSPFSLALRADRIEMLENGNVVSYWNSGQMHVASFVGEVVILGNHQLEKRGTGTVVRAL